MDFEDFNPVILAIPMYFTLMAVELIYEGVTKRRTYRLNDAITNINTGVIQQLLNTFSAVIKVGLYTLIYKHAALFHFEESWPVFVAAMVFWDLCYYWSHRMAHEVSLFWGGHVVHHQSEEYNLSVALRQTSTGFIWGFPFYIPMAILGISPTFYLLAGGFNLLYQFWIHTEHINKLPRWVEAVLNTPSHHRVHHGRDPKYLDKNYAGILIIWDRMFGTFKAEEERPNYGITKPLKSWNPIYANVAHYIDLARSIPDMRSGRDVIRLLFHHPGWSPDYVNPYVSEATSSGYQKYNADRRSITGYLLFQFVIFLGLNAFYFFAQGAFALEVKIGFAMWIMGSALIFGFLFERPGRWVEVLEVSRLIALLLGLWTMHQHYDLLPAFAVISVACVAAVSVTWFLIRSFR